MTDQPQEMVVTGEIKPVETPKDGVTPEPLKRDDHGRFAGGVHNPGGRPKNTSITALLRERLETMPEGLQKTYKELLVENLLNQSGIFGDLPTTKLVMNYVDGMPKQSIEHSGELGTYTTAMKQIFNTTDDDFADETADGEVDEPRSLHSEQEPGSSTLDAQPVAGEVQPTPPTA